MQYTRDDYRKDLEIVALGADGVEATEAKLRIRLYEAGRYEQLHAFINQKDDAETAHDRLMDQLQCIDDDVFQSLQRWLNTPSGDHELWMQRKEEYERKRQEAEAHKTQLQEAYYKKYDSQKRGGCYVATCVYGSYDCPQVWTLRRFRDNTLASTWYGRAFIHTYYVVSPTLVKWFGHTDWFKNLWRGKLDTLVSKLQAEGVEDTPYSDKIW